MQVRLKKEVLDESIRGNAKQRALVGATSLNGDQWYVQQASRSAPTCTTHALIGVSVPQPHLGIEFVSPWHPSDLHKDTWPASSLSLDASAISKLHVTSHFAPASAHAAHGYSSKWFSTTETLQQGLLVKQASWQCLWLCCGGVAEQ